jgi:uncharacterized repeat protein (TIGR03803 family)
LANGAEKTVYEFRDHKGGTNPESPMIVGESGGLYGTAAFGGQDTETCTYGCGTVFKLAADGRESVLYVFAGGSDGARPNGLVRYGDGNMYGTTFSGGSGANCGGGCGTVFKISADKTEAVLYSFQGGSDGLAPGGGLVADAIGNFYGETTWGGSFSGANCDVAGCGTVFEIEPDGTKLTLHTFQSGNDGDLPQGGLAIDGAGNLYGTTYGGGGSGCNGAGCGTVFEIAPDGTETVLYAFQGGSDGEAPVGLVLDDVGNLYGATEQGGNCSSGDDCGTIYKLAPGGAKTLLYSFKGGSNDGQTPEAAMVMDKAGNLYGTTFSGGDGCKNYGGCGIVFEITRNGTEAVLSKLTHNVGSNPAAALLLDGHSTLYGVAGRGGQRDHGAVFKIKK